MEQEDQFHPAQVLVHPYIIPFRPWSLPFLSRRVVRIMQIIYRVIQNITLRFNELDHLPQRLHSQHLRLSERINLQSPHKRELLQLETGFPIWRSLSVGAEGNDC